MSKIPSTSKSINARPIERPRVMVIDGDEVFAEYHEAPFQSSVSLRIFAADRAEFDKNYDRVKQLVADLPSRYREFQDQCDERFEKVSRTLDVVDDAIAASKLLPEDEERVRSLLRIEVTSREDIGF